MAESTGKQQVAKELWLLYYNRTLLERKVITEQEYRRMNLLIRSRTSGRTK